MAAKSYVALPMGVMLMTLMLGVRAGSAHGETIVTDDQVSVVDTDVARPARGMTMQKVESKFGAPAERHPAVGTPAITRWDYQSFSVFFENDRVIHAVVASAQ
jgi:hypothetical protein